MNIRKVDAASKVINAVAFHHPCDTQVVGSMAVDHSRYLYFADAIQVFPVDTVAGGMGPGSMAICRALAIAGLVHPAGLALDSRGNLYVADSSLSAVIKVGGIARQAAAA